MRIGIIGAGAAGIASAIRAHQLGAQVHLVDANAEPGKKLSATGSGRCNISNRAAKADTYFTDDHTALQRCFERLPNATVCEFLASLGIPTTSSEDGWVYPLSYSASNVVGILVDNLAGILYSPHTLITQIKKESDGFILSTDEKLLSPVFDAVIVAGGSPANPQLGARNNLYTQIRELGHTIFEVRPALTPLETDTRLFHKLQGVRMDIGIDLLYNEKSIVHNTGNIIFTKWGLNGPGVMDISHMVSPQQIESYSLRINFLPTHFQDIKNNLQDPALINLSLLSHLNAFLPSKVSLFLLQQANLISTTTSQELSAQQRSMLLDTIQNQVVQLRAVRGFQHAQASTGGVPLAEIESRSMESRICSGLFFAGEIVNVLGPCGGYNLHWAFMSGLIAAEGAALRSL
ncbi:MAG TPA: hypothetical protein DCK95_11125 [Anaerolineaceae bacterium]|nr:hypothetical protein [Anaerolineaceae bacterium]